MLVEQYGCDNSQQHFGFLLLWLYLAVEGLSRFHFLGEIFSQLNVWFSGSLHAIRSRTVAQTVLFLQILNFSSGVYHCQSPKPIVVKS